jgi:hypothetical protein
MVGFRQHLEFGVTPTCVTTTDSPLLSCLGDRIGDFFLLSVRILTSYVNHVHIDLFFLLLFLSTKRTIIKDFCIRGECVFFKLVTRLIITICSCHPHFA